MRHFGWIALCFLLIVALCACKKEPSESAVSTPMSDVGGEQDSQSTTSTTTTTTTGALVVTDPQGEVVTTDNGVPVTTHVTALPTSTRPVTAPNGSTVTEDDGTVKTEVVIPPHITVSTDTQGTTHTSRVPEQTVTTTTTTTTQPSLTTEPTSSTQEPTSTTEPTSSTQEPTSTTEPTTSTTEPTTSTQEPTSTTEPTNSTTSTTKPTQQEITNAVSLPAEGYAPDNRIKLGEVSLSGQTVTMVIRNISPVWETEDGKSYFEYTCYDRNNYKLLVGKIEFGYISVKSSKTCTFDIPEGTVKVELTDFQAEYWSIPI